MNSGNHETLLAGFLAETHERRRISSGRKDNKRHYIHAIPLLCLRPTPYKQMFAVGTYCYAAEGLMSVQKVGYTVYT